MADIHRVKLVPKLFNDSTAALCALNKRKAIGPFHMELAAKSAYPRFSHPLCNAGFAAEKLASRKNSLFRFPHF